MIGNKVRQRREELGLSQDELARRCGYKSRSSINKIELNINDVTQSKILVLAKALETDPMWLLKEDVETFDTPEAFEKHWNAIGGGRHPLELSDLEHTLVVNFRASDPVTQSNVLKLLDIPEKREDTLNA
jgi:transcriptional regulator with XRE-family HTH domain